MTDQTQTQDPQTQWAVQNQDTNKDFDMFGWDNDIFESENLIPIDGEWEINKNEKNDFDNDNFDDDIDVDYRNEWNFTAPVVDSTPQTEVTNNTNDLWDFDFSEVVNPTQPGNPTNDTNNDLWTSNFEPTIPTNTTETTQTDDIWDDFGVYDEPDNPNDYVSPDEISDDITDLDADTVENDVNTPNTNTDEEVSNNDFVDLDQTEVLDPINESEDEFNEENENIVEIPPMTPQEIQTANDEITSNPEVQVDDEDTQNIPETNVQDDIDEDDELLYSDTDDLDDYNEWVDNSPETEELSEPNTTLDNTTYERDEDKTHIQNKFLELKFETEKIFQLVKKDYNIWFDILWANDDRQKIMYKLFIQDNAIDIQKNITDKSDNTQISHSLKFELDDATLKTYIDNELLYDEITDLTDDSNKNKQVVEKLNKFIFLITEEYKKIIKDKKAKDHENIKKATFREF